MKEMEHDIPAVYGVIHDVTEEEYEYEESIEQTAERWRDKQFNFKKGIYLSLGSIFFAIVYLFAMNITNAALYHRKEHAECIITSFDKYNGVNEMGDFCIKVNTDVYYCCKSNLIGGLKEDGYAATDGFLGMSLIVSSILLGYFLTCMLFAAYMLMKK